MAASKVPKFGEWEGGENYTVYFDKARKKKNNGQIINPNDPQDYPELFQQNGAPIQPPRPDPKTKVPKFGAWETEENVGYTAYFENARKSKTGEATFSEDEPQLNRDMDMDPPYRAQPGLPKPHPKQESLSKVPHFGAWEGGEDVGYTQTFENVRKSNKNGRTVNPEPVDGPKMNRDVGEPQGKEGRSRVPEFGGWNEGEDAQYTVYFDNARKNKNPGHGFDPVEPQLNRDVSDRSRPGNPGGHLRNGSKGSSTSEMGSRHGKQIPGSQSPHNSRGGRLQQRHPGNQGSQTPERGATVPTWGGWNNDPKKAEDYTSAFRRAKEEKNTPLPPNIPQSYHKESPEPEPNKSCFSWLRFRTGSSS